jgi:hypothetical protein
MDCLAPRQARARHQVIAIAQSAERRAQQPALCQPPAVSFDLHAHLRRCSAADAIARV